MYVNKCIKCGAEFETKNPKRVICPNCLYADKGNEGAEEKPLQSYSSYSSYSADPKPRSYDRPAQGGYRNNYQRDNRGQQGGGYQRRDNNRNNNFQRRQGSRSTLTGGNGTGHVHGGRCRRYPVQLLSPRHPSSGSLRVPLSRSTCHTRRRRLQASRS